MFDAEYTYYDIVTGNSYVQIENWRQIQKGLHSDYDLDTESVNAALKRHRSDEDRNPDLPRQTRNITFVHVGKAGGSSIGCTYNASRLVDSRPRRL
jgi:hypothetical protein